MKGEALREAQQRTGSSPDSATAPTVDATSSLHLALQDAERDLAELQEHRNSLLAQADVARAMACEPGRHTSRHNCRATSLRLEAFQMGPDLAAAKRRVRDLESQLNGAPAQAAPIVLSAAQLAAVDDTAGLVAA